MKEISALDLNGASFVVKLIELPDECPLCHVTLQPIYLSSYALGSPPIYSAIQSMFRCTSNGCQRIFIATYESLEVGDKAFYIKNTAPKTVRAVPLSDEISRISPSFEEIYNQSFVAESHGLSQIVGVGLRKALEFLIKDYAVQNNPDEETAIKNMFLSECINDHIDSEKIKACAERAAWLGNDQTHYMRKWEDKDIEDLKLLIKLTCHWVEHAELTEQYINDMPKKS